MGLDDYGIGVRFLAEVRDSSFPQQALSPELARLRHEADNYPPSSAKVKILGATPPLPVSLLGVVLNYKSTRKTLVTFTLGIPSMSKAVHGLVSSTGLN
jgi:hypothetical protein